MNKSIEALVDRGLELREQIERLEAELEGIEGRLKEEGLERAQEYLVDEDREGRRWLACGSDRVVPVVFTADKLMGQFGLNSAQHQTVKLQAGSAFPEFWKLQQVFENRFDDGKKFRKRASELLGDRAPVFVTACLARDKFGMPKSDVKVCWKDSEAA